MEKINDSCYICDKINRTFERYIATIFHLFRHEDSFRQKFRDCQGFCNQHYTLLYKTAPKYLSGDQLKDFTNQLNTLYIDNMKRVRDDLDWFIDKLIIDMLIGLGIIPRMHYQELLLRPTVLFRGRFVTGVWYTVINLEYTTNIIICGK